MKRSIEFKIYIGVPRARNAMPPPLPTPVRPRGGAHLPTCVFARRQGHIIVQRMEQGTQASTQWKRHAIREAATAMNTQLDKHTETLPL